METGIRPLSLGEILDRTAFLYRSNFLLFAGIFAVYAGLLLVFGLAQLGVTSLVNFAQAAVAVKILLVCATIAEWFFIIAAAGITTAAINRAVAWVNLGQPATIASAYKSVLPRTGRYIWLMAIMYSMIGWPVILLGVIFGGVVFSIPGLMSGHIDANNKGTVITLLAAAVLFALCSLGWFVYAVIMGIRYSLAVPVCVMEDLKARASIKRSILLTKGSRGRIFVLFLLVMAIEIGLSTVSQGFLIVLAIKHHGQVGPVAQSIAQIVSFFTNSFLGPIYATGITLFYYDQRIRKEGFDIEWMMHSAGLSAPQEAAVASIMPVPTTSEPLPGTESAHE
ncbi:MAG: glycerophosphoryl diester phosphodiesterase membrane domain-containing protein [Acidobacteriota bacterium]|nr:glycerophosphoryl diester phosphodiesterase membrane domain-containing protein [Acidobacteriota bacterium]